MSDHYEMAERLLSAVGNTADADDRRQCLMEAQVHVGLAGVDETRRMSALMNGVDEALSEFKGEAAGALAETSTTRTIPWPPSGELVETVASMLEATDGGDYDAIARAVLDAIGGEA